MKAQDAPIIRMMAKGMKLTPNFSAIDRATGNMKTAAAARLIEEILFTQIVTILAVKIAGRADRLQHGVEAAIGNGRRRS